MSENKYIDLYRNERLKQDDIATAIIKDKLVQALSKDHSFNYVLNSIIRLFHKYLSDDLTNKSNLKHLYDTFEKSKNNYKEGKTLNVIPNELKDEFLTSNIDGLTFEDYLIKLAKRVSFSTILRKFRSDTLLYENMYRVGRFDNYTHLDKFDIRWFQKESYYSEMEKEIRTLAYPQNNNYTKVHSTVKSIKNIGLPIEFHKDFVSIMTSREIYNTLEGYYFNDYEVDFETYNSVFFSEPNSHYNSLHLDCETSLFAGLLDQLQKQNIARKISYSLIDKYKLFTTINGKHLTRANISNSIRNVSDSNRKIIDETIELISAKKRS